MPARLPYTLQSNDSHAFRASGERTHLLAWIQRTCPELTQSVRAGIARMIERGLDALGRDAMNLAITDLTLFEQRLALTPLVDSGYAAYFPRRLRWAARFFHAAAHEADGTYLQRLRRTHGPSPADARQAGATPFTVLSDDAVRRQTHGQRAAAGGHRARTRDSAMSAAAPAAAGTQAAPLTAIETAVVRNLERLEIPVDQELVKYVLPVALRAVDTADKVTTLQRFVDDLRRQVQADGNGDDRAAVDAVAEQLIAQILYPRVVDRLCPDRGNAGR